MLVQRSQRLHRGLCAICATPRPDDPEIVAESFLSESFSFQIPNEFMLQTHEEEDQQDAIAGSRGGKGESKSEILRQIQRAFAFLHHGRQSSYDPYRLIMASKPLNLQFPVTSQNDASEYYDKILDALDQGLRKEGNEEAAATLRNCFGHAGEDQTLSSVRDDFVFQGRGVPSLGVDGEERVHDEERFD